MSAELTKAVVLARGLGTRMRSASAGVKLDVAQSRAADAGVKAMIPVGRPFLDYVLSGLADAGFQEIALVIGPEHDSIRHYYADLSPRRFALTFVVQNVARGTADAVLAAETFVARDEFVVMNGDNYYPISALRSLRKFAGPGAFLFDSEGLVRNGNIPAERIQSYAYARISGDELVELIEKPGPEARIPANAPVSMNLWRFSPEMFDHCRRVERSSRREYELPGAVNRALRHGMRLKVEISNLGVLDLSRRVDIPAVAERLRNLEVSL